MNELINYILKFGNLNQQQIEFIKSKIAELEFKRASFVVITLNCDGEKISFPEA